MTGTASLKQQIHFTGRASFHREAPVGPGAPRESSGCVFPRLDSFRARLLRCALHFSDPVRKRSRKRVKSRNHPPSTLVAEVTRSGVSALGGGGEDGPDQVCALELRTRTVTRRRTGPQGYPESVNRPMVPEAGCAAVCGPRSGKIDTPERSHGAVAQMAQIPRRQEGSHGPFPHTR